MSPGLAAMTPETAFEMYRGVIEDFEQAAPMIMAERDGAMTVYQLIGPEVRDVLRSMADQGERFDAVLLSVEARMWRYEGGVAVTEGPVDTAVFQYADRDGKTWMATRQFARLSVGNIKWLGDLTMEPEDSEGAVPEGLARLVGRTR